MEVVRNREIMPKAARPEHKQAKPTSHFNTIRQFHRMPGRKVAAGSEGTGEREMEERGRSRGKSTL